MPGFPNSMVIQMNSVSVRSRSDSSESFSSNKGSMHRDSRSLSTHLKDIGPDSQHILIRSLAYLSIW